MQYKTRGLVLHAVKYTESSLIAQIYTSEFGRQSYMVQGIRSKSSKFRISHFQPLILLDMEVDHKSNRDLQRIRELKIRQPFHHIYSDIGKNTIALFIGEVLYRCLRDTEGNKTIFDYLENAVQILDICEEGSMNFHLLFLVQFTRFIGIFPENPEALDNFQPSNSEMNVHDLVSYTLKDLHKLKVSKQTRFQLLNAIIEYYYYHIEGMGKVSSLSILHEVFS